jgi:polyphosphate kinase 2 (PPK2 family)
VPRVFRVAALPAPNDRERMLARSGIQLIKYGFSISG